jgi:hypothetical protein
MRVEDGALVQMQELTKQILEYLTFRAKHVAHEKGHVTVQYGDAVEVVDDMRFALGREFFSITAGDLEIDYGPHSNDIDQSGQLPRLARVRGKELLSD